MLTEVLEINTTNFPQHFKAYTLLHKVSLVVSRMKIETENLEWFVLNQSAVHVLNLSALPVTSAITPIDFNRLSSSLFKFLDFKSRYPEPEDALYKKHS